MIIGLRQFCNKIWNSYKFAMMNIGSDFHYDPANIKPDLLNLADKWILAKLAAASADINASFQTYMFCDAAGNFQQFWVDCFCDIYLEYSKIALKADHRALHTKTIL